MYDHIVSLPDSKDKRELAGSLFNLLEFRFDLLDKDYRLVSDKLLTTCTTVSKEEIKEDNYHQDLINTMVKEGIKDFSEEELKRVFKFYSFSSHQSKNVRELIKAGLTIEKLYGKEKVKYHVKKKYLISP